MKKLLILIAASMITLNTIAQDSKKQDPIFKQEKFCAMLKDGQMVLMHEGLPVTSEVTLNDGGKVTPACLVIRRSGIVISLNSGDCIDKEGNITNVNIPETPIKSEKKIIKKAD